MAALFGTIAASAALMAGGSVAAQAQPLHTMLSGRFAQPPTTAQCLAALQIACYSPLQYQRAYDMNGLYRGGLTGTGQTIAIVDSFGSPTAEADLKVFDQAYGLPDPPSFKIIQPAGPVPPFDPGNATVVGWGVETSLDLQYAHAMAPGANILLVETPVAETQGVTGFPEIVKAENYVINNKMASVISQSFGATIVKVETQAFQQMGGQGQQGMMTWMRSFMDPSKQAQSYAVGANTEEGWFTVGNGNQNPAVILLAAPAAIVAIGAAVALPAFAQARTSARSTASVNACINNLRQIDGAKEHAESFAGTYGLA